MATSQDFLYVEDRSVENSESSNDKMRADWGLDIHQSPWKTEEDGEEVLQHHHWYPNKFQGY